MKRDPTQPNIDMYCGILDIYHGNITSFKMSDTETCNVKDRINGGIVSNFDIEV